VRAAYACQWYEFITGAPAPVMTGGIMTAARDADLDARRKIAVELGHGDERIDVTAAYLGGTWPMKPMTPIEREARHVLRGYQRRGGKKYRQQQVRRALIFCAHAHGRGAHHLGRSGSGTSWDSGIAWRLPGGQGAPSMRIGTPSITSSIAPASSASCGGIIRIHPDHRMAGAGKPDRRWSKVDSHSHQLSDVPSWPDACPDRARARGS
jgi:hypothetical protein